MLNRAAPGIARWLPLRCRRGAPALEFAFAVPILFIMFVGLTDIGRAMMTTRRLTLAAQEVAEAAATFAATAGATGVILSSQANQAMSIAAANFPQWLGSNNPGYGVTLTSVAIVPTVATCTSNCTYKAQTAWSLAIKGGQPTLRSCGTLTAVPNSQRAALTTVPSGLLNPPSILIVDVTTVYNPIFGNFITGPFQLLKTAYMPPRGLGGSSYVQLSVDQSISGSTFTGQTCPGYP